MNVAAFREMQEFGSMFLTVVNDCTEYFFFFSLSVLVSEMEESKGR